MVKFGLLLVCLLFGSAVVLAAPAVEFRDGDRVIFLGNEFFEREQDQCYIETLLTTRFPGKNLTFRNLGYAGDNVWAEARTLCSGWDQFGPEDQGFERLKKLVGEFKPTLVFVAYGMNESFDGPGGVGHFREGLERLLDMLAKTGARVVLVSPIPHENLGPPLPDPAIHNRELALYSAAMQDVAHRRGLAFIDLLGTLGPVMRPGGHPALTSDGIHLTPLGYRQVATTMEQRMGYPPRAWGINIDASTGNCGTTGITLKDLSHNSDRVSFSATAETLPVPLPTPNEERRMLQVRDLAPGDYVLKIDGSVAAWAPAEAWSRGVYVSQGPDDQQTEALRKSIVEKNFDYFNYWRPQNDTYIFGYRKHEQGRNAVEVPRFKEAVPTKESQIAKLRGPVSHAYVLGREASK